MKDVFRSFAKKETPEKPVWIAAFFAYLPIGLAMAMLIPDNILDYHWARIYVDFISSWLPCVAEVGRWTKVPSTQFIAAVMNLLAMLWMLWHTYIQLHYILEKTLKWQSEKSTKGKFFYWFIFPPVFLYCAWFAL